ncbi:peptidoglycan-binding protein [Paracoccaceae bacterium]|nr:peptidoglycan-binding protein [Paracoccaceae bacterium]
MRYFLLVILITLLPNFSLSDEVTAEAQRLLNELGYNAGPVDGLIGGKTRNAMSDAFKSVGKEWDRELDVSDLAILRDILEQKTNGEPRTLNEVYLFIC